MPSESENFACCDGVESINLIFTFAHSTTHTHTHIDFNRSVSESVSFLYFSFSPLLLPLLIQPPPAAHFLLLFVLGPGNMIFLRLVCKIE